MEERREGRGRSRRRRGGRDTSGKRNLRDRRCRDTAGRAVNYKRSAKPLWSSLGGAGVSRRIDNTEFVRGRRNLDGPWFIQPPEPASQPASQPANRARLDTSTMLRFSRCLSSSFHHARHLSLFCPPLSSHLYAVTVSVAPGHPREHTYTSLPTGFPIVLSSHRLTNASSPRKARDANPQ